MVIIAAVDRTERSATVIDEAEQLANAFEEPVHVVHVLTRKEFIDMGRTAASKTGSSISMADVEEAATEVATKAASDLDVPAEPVGLMGSPADTIVEYATDHEARYIVVASRKRSPTGKAVFGSVAQTILLESPAPVVTRVT